MIELEITEGQKCKAFAMYDFDTLKDSITDGKSKLWGALGEIVVHDFFNDQGYETEYKPTKDFDLVISTFTVDVKTKRTTVKPRMNYWATIAATSKHQRCDMYFFVRILKNLSTAYLLGYLPSDTFWEVAKFYKKGEIDPLGDGEWRFAADCYNVKMEDLYAFKEADNQ